ncbi:hypothetical protein GCM10009578_052570 [Streptomyces rhizosphaericus]|uniref:Uncharacterized protein n=1 Tax=Streptomyces rhizosphaericus TaxID=114699 RepID=A0ABP4AWF9_9ACTN
MVFALLGAHPVGDVRTQSAARLPEAFALILLNPPQSAEPLPSGAVRPRNRRVDRGRRRADRGLGRQRRAVHRRRRRRRGPASQLLLQLPVGYDLLFGRPQPT